jgi:hypothetical protein
VLIGGTKAKLGVIWSGMRNVTIRDFAEPANTDQGRGVGLRVANCVSCDYEQCNVEGCRYGLYIDGAGDEATCQAFSSCRFRSSLYGAYLATNMVNIVFRNCVFESNGGPGTLIRFANLVSFSGCWWENNCRKNIDGKTGVDGFEAWRNFEEADRQKKGESGGLRHEVIIDHGDGPYAFRDCVFHPYGGFLSEGAFHLNGSPVIIDGIRASLTQGQHNLFAGTMPADLGSRVSHVTFGAGYNVGDPLDADGVRLNVIDPTGKTVTIDELPAGSRFSFPHSTTCRIMLLAEAKDGSRAMAIFELHGDSAAPTSTLLSSVGPIEFSDIDKHPGTLNLGSDAPELRLSNMTSAIVKVTYVVLR